MAFPFLAPLKSWIEGVLKERESNSNSIHTLKPFAILSSAAVVSKGGTPTSIKNMIAGDKISGIYNGCVVTNTLDTAKVYQTGATIVGYDLDGKEIIVDGEKNRRVSVPIITKIDIDTDGGNNTLKTAKVDIKVFTLKQLEMFELFFLRPSMNVVLEYGWNSDIRSNSHLIDSYLFAKKKHSDYIKKYLEIFSHKEDAYRESKVKYLDTLEKTKGCYDFMAGKVTNFTYSPDVDGTYNINLEISAGNELQLWMPIKQANSTNTNQNQSKNVAIDAYDTFLNKLAADLNHPNLKNLIPKKDWENEFFNWGISNEKQKDTKYSKEAYISFKLILHILNQPTLFKIKPKTIKSAFFEDKALTKEIIPIHSHSNIISTTDLFILPGDLPKIEVSEIGKKNIIHIAGKYDEKSKTFTASPLVDAKINGKSFNLNLSEIYDSSGVSYKITQGRVGNLLNVFFRYDSFVQAFNQSYTQADILNNILQSMNDNMFGLCSLQFQKDSDLNDGAPLSIIDKKLPIEQPDVDAQKIYRFKIGTNGSIVKAFEFNMELSTLMQAQALYSTQLALNKAINNDTGPDITPVAQKDDFSSADLSYATNADGYYSINSIEVKLVKEAQAWNKYIADTTNTTSGSVSEEKQPTAAEVKKEMLEVLESKYVKFKLKIKDKNPAPNGFIYLDSSLILKYVKDNQKNTTALTYLDISFTLDGIAGISCGEYFHIDGIPEIYNRNGYFQVTNVKHTIDDKGWETKVEAGYRIKSETQIFKDV